MRRKRGNRRSKDLGDDLDVLEGVYSRTGRKHRSRSFATLIGLLLLAGVLGVIYIIYTTAISGGASGDGLSKVTVAEGDTLTEVADKLQEAGAIQSATAFKLEARLEGGGALIKPGEYTFAPGTDGGEILDELNSDKPPPTFTMTIPEGLTVEQAAQKVSEQSNVKAGEFEAAAGETSYGYAFLNEEGVKTTEGYLFPKKYEFEKGANASQVVNRMLEQYLIETQNLDFSEAGGRPNLSEHELVTVASLIEREAANSEEGPLVASVIYNRLKQDMPLQLDATIQYARGEPKERLSLKDLEIKSPYNTYQNRGLPPGPIASPSLGSLKAAIDPAETDHLYYVLKKNGKEHFFTKDYDKFLEAKEEAGL